MDNEHLGWSVSAGAHNGTRMVVRPFVVGTFHRADAEHYAREQMALDYPPRQGWMIVVSAMPITRPMEATP